MRKSISVLAAAVAAVVSLVVQPARASAPSIASAAPPAWPVPLTSPSATLFDFVHYGENHHNEHGGPVVNGEIFRQTNAYAAAFLATSADMANVGSLAELSSFKEYITQGFSPVCPKSKTTVPCQAHNERPWFHSMGNHDREPVAGPGGVLSYTNGVFRTLFADQNGPFGDGPVPAGFAGSADDGPGASTHYWVENDGLRLIVLDNSCHSFTTCDALTLQEEGCAGTPACRSVGQHPPVGPGHEYASQLAFMVDAAREAKAAGKLVFVMMHEPTEDPRYTPNVDGISLNHTMNKGVTTDNQAFEAAATATDVDGVLTAHIKGNNVYTSLGVPYYIDGGGGGRPYARDTWGVDFGTYYGYRVFRIEDRAVVGTWLVPVLNRIDIRQGGATVSGEITVAKGATIDLDALGHSPTCTPAQFITCSNQDIQVELRRPTPPAGFESGVPTPAYVWHTSDPSILAPVGARAEPGFDPATMSAEGAFRATDQGTVAVTVLAGWTTATIIVNVI